jgi:hypothetical protein
MRGIHEEWTVLPHDDLTRLDDDLFTAVGQLRMPMGTFPRRMTVVRLAGSRLVIYSAIALDEAQMQVLEALGKPTYLVVPSAIHRKDAKIWKARYPELVVLAPEGARAKVEEVVAVDGSGADFRDPSVTFVTVDGTGEREAALLVNSASGTTLVVNDLLWNVPDRPGFGGWLFRVAGFTGAEPKIPGVVVRNAIEDRQAVKAQLERWSALARLNRIVVSHGEIITDDPPAVLGRLARALAPAERPIRHRAARAASAP